MDFKVEIAGFVAFFVVVIFIPLTVFAPHLCAREAAGHGRLRRAGEPVHARNSRRSGCTAARRPDEALLGSADIQSLADLGNSYGFVQEMRFVPFG